MKRWTIGFIIACTIGASVLAASSGYTPPPKPTSVCGRPGVGPHNAVPYDACYSFTYCKDHPGTASSPINSGEYRCWYSSDPRNP